MHRRLKVFWRLARTVDGFRGLLELSRLALCHQLSLWIGWPRPGKLLPVHMRPLNGGSVFCRIGSVDINVLHATFVRRCHLPPRDLPEVTTILDLGSNIGFTVAHYACLFPRAKILGIELDADNFELCKRNIAPYKDRCEVLHGAAWCQDGTVGYTAEAEDGGQLSESSYHIASGQQKIKQTVASYGMSTLVRRLGSSPVDFVKCDIEGGEQVIIGAGETWLPAVRCLKVEIHEPYTVQECLHALPRFGFDPAIADDHPACVIAVNSALWSSPARISSRN